MSSIPPCANTRDSGIPAARFYHAQDCTFSAWLLEIVFGCPWSQTGKLRKNEVSKRKMQSRLDMAKLTMALSHYDRHIPFFDGSGGVDGVDLEVLEVGQSDPLKHGRDRHERMLQKAEFDICELSLSNYLVAKSRAMRFMAVPGFPSRRLLLS